MNTIFHYISDIHLTLIEVLQLGTFTITTVTALILVLTYRRNRRIELENHFFKLKFDAYAEIVYEMESLFSRIRLVISDLDSAIRMENTMADEKLKTLGEEIDKAIIESDLLITKHSIFFSENSVNYLGQFSRNLYGYYTSAATQENLLEKINEYYDLQLDLANKANIEIRKELKFEILNKALFQRIR